MGLAVFRGYISMISPWMKEGNLTAFLRFNPNVDRIKLVSGSCWRYTKANCKETKCIDICVGLCYIHTNNMVGKSIVRAISAYVWKRSIILDSWRPERGEFSMMLAAALGLWWLCLWPVSQMSWLLRTEPPWSLVLAVLGWRTSHYSLLILQLLVFRFDGRYETLSAARTRLTSSRHPNYYLGTAVHHWVKKQMFLHTGWYVCWAHIN